MNEMMEVKTKEPVAAVVHKKFMGLLDEYSRPLNPWRLVPTYGVADVSDLSEIKSQFRKFGIVVVRRVYDPGCSVA